MLMMHGQESGLVTNGPADAHIARHHARSELGFVRNGPTYAPNARHDARLRTWSGQERPS